jgi:hypothetical protein
LIFAGEAYNVKQGVSNELVPNERSTVPSCMFNPTPEDSTNIVNSAFADVVLFAAFMRFSAPPTPAKQSTAEENGSSLFDLIGCANCHSRSLTTAASHYTGMSNVTYHPYSDFTLHQMGSGLADSVNQGAAGGDEFRTAPLWGVEQRLFFLHDGRTSDLGAAIEAHSDIRRTDVVTDNAANRSAINPTDRMDPGSPPIKSQLSFIVHNGPGIPDRPDIARRKTPDAVQVRRRTAWHLDEGSADVVGDDALASDGPDVGVRGTPDGAERYQRSRPGRFRPPSTGDCHRPGPTCHVAGHCSCGPGTST